jgi:lipoprotein NlpD
MKIYNFAALTLIAITTSSCFDSEAVKVVIVDKSINKNLLSQNNNAKINHKVEKTKTKIASKNVKLKNDKKTLKTNQNWITPINAKILKGFSNDSQGITFDSQENQSVVAIADGIVVYSGNSLKSYGFMVIIKHKYGFYSHYMFNKKSLVGVGDNVNQGDKLAITGKNKFYLSMKKFTTVLNPSKYIKL